MIKAIKIGVREFTIKECAKLNLSNLDIRADFKSLIVWGAQNREDIKITRILEVRFNRLGEIPFIEYRCDFIRLGSHHSWKWKKVEPKVSAKGVLDLTDYLMPYLELEDYLS